MIPRGNLSVFKAFYFAQCDLHLSTRTA